MFSIDGFSYFLMKTFITREEKNNIFQLLLNDLDVVHVAALSENDLRWPKFECNLAEILKPPSQRYIAFSAIFI